MEIWNFGNLVEMMFWIWLMDDFRICGVRRNGDSLFFIKLWSFSLICFNFFFNWVEMLVCLMMSLFRMRNLWFKVFIELCVNIESDIVFWWFCLIVVIILLNFLFMVLMNDERWWFCWVMVLVSLMLLLFSVCMWCCRVVILFEVVVLNSDFEILLMKLNSFCFDFDEFMYFCEGGSLEVGISWWMWWIVELILVIYCIFRRFSDFMMCFVVWYCGML